MEYYKLLQLEREPFSNSPDPDYFFKSRPHLGCMQKLELALRLKRGLNVIIGDVGTGKTTICREMIRKFSKEEDIETHLILDPAFTTTDDFLDMLHTMLCEQTLPQGLAVIEKKEAIKQVLFKKGVHAHKTIVLFIDEGQKISAVCMEILRELLNFETNTYKLLQIAIFAQQEFLDVLAKHPNFSDRINLLHHLTPMNFGDTCRMIHHRLKLASPAPKPVNLFTLPARWAIYRASKGYPRRIIHLCHQSVLAMIIQNRTRAGWALIRANQKRLRSPAATRFHAGWVAIALPILLVAAGLLLYPLWKTEFPPPVEHFPIPAPSQAFTAPAPMGVPEWGHDEGEIQGSVEEIVFSPNEQVASRTIDADPSAAVAPASGEDLAPKADTSESIASASADPLLSQPMQPPGLLGELRVQSGDTFYKLVSGVYGAFHSTHVKAVLQANPRIINPDAIEIGQTILFPAVQFKANPLLAQSHWIILENQPNLGQAMARMKGLANQERLPVRMIAAWTPEKELRFFLVVRGFFANMETAVSFLDLMPPTVAMQATIVSDWPAKTLLFGDPYSDGVR